jgi:hypothetical protein
LVIQLQLVVEDGDLAIPDGGDLGDLLLQRHARDQVIDARLDRGGSILVHRQGGFGGGRGGGKRDRRTDGAQRSADVAQVNERAEAAHRA